MPMTTRISPTDVAPGPAGAGRTGLDAPPDRTVLLVDDEENILASLRRLLRPEGYRILTADGGPSGLDVLEREPVGVIISDQRMPGMTGVEFLTRVKAAHPETVRIVLSGFTDLNSVTDAINRGAIYKFLTKPWDDDLLRTNVREAFDYFELKRENRRLTQALLEANERLHHANRRLEQEVDEKTHLAALSSGTLRLSQEIIELLPVGVVGVAVDGQIVLANRAAHEMLSPAGDLLVGVPVERIFPADLRALYAEAAAGSETGRPVHLGGGRSARAQLCALGVPGAPRGTVVVLVP